MKTPKEILLEIVPKDCYWEDMDNLTNTPIYYVLEAMEKYAKQKLQQHVVMQAEGSDGAKEASVGNSAAGQSGSDGCSCAMPLPDLNNNCFRCNKKIEYAAWGGSDKGALPR